MKKAFWIIVPFTVAATGCAWHGYGQGPQGASYHGMSQHDMSQQGMQRHMQHVQDMDTNKDGVVSREEFTKYHEAMFDRMKNANGVIDLNAMPGQCGADARDPHCSPIPKHGG